MRIVFSHILDDTLYTGVSKGVDFILSKEYEDDLGIFCRDEIIVPKEFLDKYAEYKNGKNSAKDN